MKNNIIIKKIFLIIKMSKRSQGLHPHIVIATKELCDPEVLSEYLSNHKSVLSYIVTVEYGETGHPHIESFSTWSKEVRQDKLKASICKLYDLRDYYSKLNTKVVFNHIDPDPMYGYGYSMKENPEVKFSNLSAEFLKECLDYYKDHEEQVNLLKKEFKKTYQRLTIDDVANAYLKYIQTACKGSPVPCYFNNFMKQYKDFIPFSMYQKINQDKMNEWVCNYKERAHSLDCAPPQ